MSDIPDWVGDAPDPDELVRWAERYGHPEGWVQKAQQLHGENERLRAEVGTWKQRLVDETARLREQLHDERENAAENCAVMIDSIVDPLRQKTLDRLDDISTSLASPFSPTDYIPGNIEDALDAIRALADELQSPDVRPTS